MALTPRFTRRALVVWRRNWLAWRRFLPTSLAANLTEPVLGLLALGLGLGLFVQRIGGLSFVEFLGPGLLAGGAMMWVTFDLAFGVYDRLHWTRAYHAMIASPLSVEEIVAGEVLWQASRTALFAAGFLLILALFGIPRSLWALGVLGVAALTAVVFAGPAIAVAAAARHEEQLSYYFNLVIQPTFFFAGVFFPVDALGEGIRTVATVVPLYHAVTLARGLTVGAPPPGPELLAHGAWLVAFAGASLLLPVRFLRAALERIP